MERRALFSTVLGGSIAVSGYLGVVGRSGGGGSTAEIIPSDSTNRRVSLDVAVYAADSALLLGHSYTLPPGHADESQGVENRVDHLTASLDSGEGARHEYNPGIDTCSRDREGVQIDIEPEGITFSRSR